MAGWAGVAAAAALAWLATAAAVGLETAEERVPVRFQSPDRAQGRLRHQAHLPLKARGSGGGAAVRRKPRDRPGREKGC